VTVDHVAVVAVLVDHQTIAALGNARLSLAVRFAQAQRRTAVERSGVAVVASFRTLDEAVAADGGSAHARRAFALAAEFVAAAVGAAAGGLDVAVVALLGGSHHAVTTARNYDARLAGLGTAEDRLEREAVGDAAVAGFDVTVVADLVVRQDAVAATRWNRIVHRVFDLDA